MSKLTKWLGAIAGLLISFELAGPLLHGLFFHRLETQRQTLAKVSQQLRAKERALRQAEATTRKFEQRIKLNFERDIAKARIAYQEYLLQLADACALTSVIIGSSQPERLDDLGHILHFSLQATGTTEQMGKLIDGFYRTEALHRLAHVSIFQSLGPDSPTHSLTLDVALLVLDSANAGEGKLTLPSVALLQDVFASRDIFRKSLPGQPDSGLASSMNMLSSLFNNIPKPPPEPPTPPSPPEPALVEASQAEALPAPESPAPIDPKANVRLVGIIVTGAHKHALFCDVARDLQYTAAEQSDLSKLGIDAKVVQIRTGEIKLLEQDQNLELTLGQLYSQATLPTGDRN